MADILGAIDEEIARLTNARALIAGENNGRKRGRPVGSGRKRVAKRGMTAAGRAKIAKAMRERWAKARAAGKKGV